MKFFLKIIVVILMTFNLVKCSDAPGKKLSPQLSLGELPDTSGNKLAPDWTEIDSCFARQLFENFDNNVRKPFESNHNDIKIPSNIFFTSDLILRLAERIQRKRYSGIRIYFGAYDESIPTSRDPLYAKSPTVFFVETKIEKDLETGLDIHVDQFDECGKDNKFNPFNHGHLCPPDPPAVCKGAYFKP